MLYIWAIAFVLFLLLELSTSMALISIWFSASALITLIVSLFVDSPLIQCIIFVVVSAVLLVLTRPLVNKLRKKHVETNANLNVGKIASVTKEIKDPASPGRVRLEGVDWMAISTHGEEFSVGESVKVDKVDGAKLFVSSNR